MTEEYGHISDAFDMLPEEDLVMDEEQFSDAFDNLPEKELLMTEEQQEKLLKRIQDTIDDWTNEAIYDYNLHDVVEYETAKKLILFGANTIAYGIDND